MPGNNFGPLFKASLASLTCSMVAYSSFAFISWHSAVGKCASPLLSVWMHRFLRLSVGSDLYLPFFHLGVSWIWPVGPLWAGFCVLSLYPHQFSVPPSGMATRIFTSVLYCPSSSSRSSPVSNEPFGWEESMDFTNFSLQIVINKIKTKQKQVP